VRSFALWQQATIEITRRDHSIIACSRHIYVVLFFARIPFVVNRAFQRNTSGVVATTSCRSQLLLGSSKSNANSAIAGITLRGLLRNKKSVTCLKKIMLHGRT